MGLVIVKFLVVVLMDDIVRKGELQDSEEKGVGFICVCTRERERREERREEGQLKTHELSLVYRFCSR